MLEVKPMTKKEFVQFIKNSETSGEIDFDKGIKIIEERLEQHRKLIYTLKHPLKQEL